MHLYSKNLSTIAVISSTVKLELLPACFSCSNKFILSQNSLGSHDNHLVFHDLRDPATIAGDLINLARDLSLLLSRPVCLILKFNSFPSS